MPSEDDDFEFRSLSHQGMRAEGVPWVAPIVAWSRSTNIAAVVFDVEPTEAATKDKARRRLEALLAECRRARQVALSEEERAALKELQADSESMLAWLAAVPKDEMAWRKTAIAALDRLTGGGK